MREMTHCPICAGTQRTQVYAGTLPHDSSRAERLAPYGSHYAIQRCNGCRLIFSSPVLDEQQVDALYEQSDETNVAAGERDNVVRTMRHYYRLLRPHLRSRRRILDVGCDLGILLEIASRDGFEQLDGIEPNPTSRKLAEGTLGTPISDRFYEQENLPDEHYDAITLIHVLDHLFDPRTVLERAWRQLQPGGVMMAVVHNIESPLARVLGERFPVFNLYHHFFFSKRTLATLAESCGFEVLSTPSTWNCYSLGFFVQKLPLAPATLKRVGRRLVDACGVGRLPLALPIGNIAVIARRPTHAACSQPIRSAARAVA